MYLRVSLSNKHHNGKGLFRPGMQLAVSLIRERIGKVVSQSSFYETAPWGFESENSFLNAVICVETLYTPLETLRLTQKIELDMGRTRKSSGGVYHDRIIDIDLLLYDDLTLHTPELTLPHPLMTQRDFVMRPLVEIAGEVIHPIWKKQLRLLSAS